MLILLVISISSQTMNQILLTNPKKNWIQFFNTLKTHCGINTFVESGTYLGETAALAALCIDSVHTIEIMPDFYRKSVENLKNSANVTIYNGDSSQILLDLLPKLAKKDSRVLFWLDGHFMTCMTDADEKIDISKDEYTPIMKELITIKNSNVRNSIILIDDIRLFGSLLNNSRIERAGDPHYPLLVETCKFLDDHSFSYVVIGDILLAYDKSLELSFSPVIQACTKSRLFNGTNYSIEEILGAEKLITEAQGEELESLKELYKDFSMSWRAWHNRSPHYNLWYGLLLQHEGKYEDSSKQFEEVINLGYDHWRIYWYLAESLYYSKKINRAMSIVKDVLASNPDFKPALLLLEKMHKTVVAQ